MASINTDRYESLAARGLGVKGPGALTSIEDGVFGTLPLDTRAPVEHHSIQRIFHYIVRANFAAVAAEFGQLQVGNLQSDALVVVDSFAFGTPHAGDILAASIDRGQTAFNGQLGGTLAIAQDTRITPETLAGFGAVGTDPGGGIPAGSTECFRYAMQTNNPPVWDNFPIVLGPGGLFTLGCMTVNTLIRGYIRFHIRATLPGELS